MLSCQLTMLTYNSEHPDSTLIPPTPIPVSNQGQGGSFPTPSVDAAKPSRIWDVVVHRLRSRRVPFRKLSTNPPLYTFFSLSNWPILTSIVLLFVSGDSRLSNNRDWPRQWVLSSQAPHYQTSPFFSIAILQLQPPTCPYQCIEHGTGILVRLYACQLKVVL